ncbi:MAG: hypothetical protein IKC77_09575 [Lentisphaeria bacterium]|nr:hypothetical protein [Lentisphaeria bacterium]
MNHTLYGDGIHDDTAAIQEMLDTANCVYLPAAKNCYLISKTLRIHSQNELHLDRFTEVKLAAKSNCPMLTNDDHANGNKRICITGGIWNGNNTEQAPNPQMLADSDGNARNSDAHKRMSIPADYPADPVTGKAEAWNPNIAYHPDRYYGVIWRFVNVDGFEVQNITLKNPVSYAVQCGNVRNFTIEHVTFDYNMGNPSPDNMDGLHFDGFCRNGFIRDLKGACYDDLLAFNAEDVAVDSPGFGPIENIVVDGIFADRCHSAVRLLSCGSMVRNITIRNVYGTFYRYAIGFTHFMRELPNGKFDNITLENLHIGKALPFEEDWNRCPDWGLIWVQEKADVGALKISGFHRIEETTAVANIEIEKDSTVAQLTLDDISLENHLIQPLSVVQNSGFIGTLVFNGVCRTVTAEGANQITVIDNRGVIENRIKG